MDDFLSRVATMGDISKNPEPRAKGVVKEASEDSPPPVINKVLVEDLRGELSLREAQLEREKTTLENERREIPLPVYGDILFLDEPSTEEISFTAQRSLERQKHKDYEAQTVRLDSSTISRINKVRRKATKSRRMKITSDVKTERLTNNSFYRAIMNNVIDLIEGGDFSDCLTESQLNDKISRLLEK
ncbi:MAG: hypothetical protein K9K67_14270 [Bacteriovoracaceae bacterium]|nr:hypothetical protein [Bacteriovoracaceae bacterium]